MGEPEAPRQQNVHGLKSVEHDPGRKGDVLLQDVDLCRELPHSLHAFVILTCSPVQYKYPLHILSNFVRLS